MDNLDYLIGGGKELQLSEEDSKFKELFQIQLPDEDESFQLHLDFQYHPGDKNQLFLDSTLMEDIEEDYFTLARNLDACLSLQSEA
ncbi:MAG TPA: hypothetical protein DCZ23_05635 [Lachnospiraceae bacterium]|nr:hypothetical protein [Lachnospiraceae bacterium]